MTSSRTFVLDAFAVLSHLQDEPGAQVVEDLLRSDNRLHMCSVNVGEVYYKTIRSRDIQRARYALGLIAREPIEVIDPDRELVLAAAYLKGLHPISYADCFAAALAQRLSATLVTGDSDFRLLEHEIAIEWLPT